MLSLNVRGRGADVRLERYWGAVASGAATLVFEDPFEAVGGEAVGEA